LNTWLTFTSALPVNLAQLPVGANSYTVTWPGSRRSSSWHCEPSGSPGSSIDGPTGCAFSLAQGMAPGGDGTSANVGKVLGRLEALVLISARA